MPNEPFSLANIQAFVGRELGASRWMTLDQRRIDEFADCTDDRQWIHVDVARAQRESPLGTTIAHGYLTLAMVAPSTFEVLVEPAGHRAGAQLRARPRALRRAGEVGGEGTQPHQAARRGGEGRRAVSPHDREHDRDRERGEASPDRARARFGGRGLERATG